MALTEQERRERDYQIGMYVWWEGRRYRVINYARDDDNARWVQDMGGNVFRVAVEQLSPRKLEERR